MIGRLRARNEWKFFGVLPKADRTLAVVWWVVLVLRGVLPAMFAIAMGVLVAAVQHGEGLASRLTLVGVVFVLLQVLAPIHQAVGANLGDRTAAWLYDRLTEACVRPPGMGHLEDPKLTNDLWLLRESGVWRDRNTDEVRGAQRNADYAYRLAVDPPASKELRLFGLVGWTIDRFVARRTRLHELQSAATRLRERPVAWSMLLVTLANVAVFWSLATAAASGTLTLGAVVVFAQCAVGTSMIAFGGLNWALDGAAAPVAAVLRLEPAMAPAGGAPV